MKPELPEQIECRAKYGHELPADVLAVIVADNAEREMVAGLMAANDTKGLHPAAREWLADFLGWLKEFDIERIANAHEEDGRPYRTIDKMIARARNAYPPTR